MSSRHPLATLAPLALLLAACSDMSMEAINDLASPSAFDTAESDAAEALTEVIVDVRPSGDADVLPQRFRLDDRGLWSESTLNLQSTITLSGSIRGYAATPVGATVPGEADAPVEARITAFIEGDDHLRVVNSEADGTFALDLPRGQDYHLTVVPITPEALPASYDAGLAFLADSQRDIDLGFGVPVYGRHLQDDGTPVAVSRRPIAYLVDPLTGIAGASTRVDAEGWFALRAQPGTYTLVLEGAEGTTVPRIELPDVLVAESAEASAPIVVGAGQVDFAEVTGRVADADGRPVSNASVRFTSVDLDDAAGALEVATETDQNGLFSRQLLPGAWTMRVVPTYEAEGEASPVEQEVVIGAEGSDLGDITLSARVQLEGVVVDSAGAPLGGVVVAIEEAGFDHYVYTATTDVQGAFACNVPDTALIVRFMPSNDRGVAITPFSLPRPSEGPSTYPLGAGALIAGNASASGSPLPFAVIEVKSPSGESLGTTVTDTNGRYALRIAAP
jgi:hypothetical protein